MPQNLVQTWPRPRQAKPIIIIGAGDIVRDAHLPAYKKAEFQVAGIYDIDIKRAENLALQWGINTVYSSLEDATVQGTDYVYDIAVPPSAILNIITALPDGAAVLIQKTLGIDKEHAKKICKLCHNKKLKAAVNFQLRFSAMMLAIRDALQSGMLADELSNG